VAAAGAVTVSPQIRSSREVAVAPLRARGAELEDKLSAVRGGLALARGTRGRPGSGSKLDLSLGSLQGSGLRSLSVSGLHLPGAGSSSPLDQGDPPPYNFNQAWGEP
jgi:hypothetical protein